MLKNPYIRKEVDLALLQQALEEADYSIYGDSFFRKNGKKFRKLTDRRVRPLYFLRECEDPEEGRTYAVYAMPLTATSLSDTLLAELRRDVGNDDLVSLGDIRYAARTTAEFNVYEFNSEGDFEESEDYLSVLGDLALQYWARKHVNLLLLSFAAIDDEDITDLDCSVALIGMGKLGWLIKRGMNICTVPTELL